MPRKHHNEFCSWCHEWFDGTIQVKVLQEYVDHLKTHIKLKPKSF